MDTKFGFAKVRSGAFKPWSEHPQMRTALARPAPASEDARFRETMLPYKR